MIKAKGLFGKKELTVEVKNNKVLFNGEENEPLLSLLESYNLPMGGTYWADEGSELYYYNILKNSDFFDELKEIKASDDMGTIPYEENVIF